jgi:chromosome segregation ATPase
VVQSILFFVLGALCAVFVAVLIAPAFWRRAVRLTKRRIEATVPLTGVEIAAQKDMLRAEFAMAARRLEMTVKALQEKNAELAVQIGRAGEEAKAAARQHEEMAKSLAEAEERNGLLRKHVQEREAELQRVSARLSERERALETQTQEMTKLGRLYEEASFSSSNRQIELVARESELERLSAELSALRGLKKDADIRDRETAKEGHAIREALNLEKKKSTDLDRKLERLMATIADYEDRLDRREKELARLRGGTKTNDAAAKPGPAAQRPERKGGVETQFAQLLARGRNEDLEGAVGKLAADRDRLEAELMDGSGSDPERENELRSELLDLAAEVVVLAAKIDGPDSPVLAAFGNPTADGDGPGRSLAARAHALWNAAAD